MRYRFHSHFVKAYSKLSRKLKEKVDMKFLIFTNDPYCTIFNNHPLIGKYKNYRSINISGDYRAIYKELTKEEVVFVKLGTHSELYG